MPGWDAGYLWGPPGTGKTTALGALLATYLLLYPTRRVLLLSTTNTAVDLALVAVDRALERLSPKSEAARAARRKCARLGSHFVARHYRGREHLIPAIDENIVKALILVEAQRPDPEDVQAYAKWKGQVESLRSLLRQHALSLLERSRLAAMTTALATFWLRHLRAFAPFDLIVFDEASQVGQAYALALAPIAKHVVFAGDPYQLAPIVRSGHEEAQEWLGTSMFCRMDEDADSTCFLNEQSRMAPEICSVVSNVFYHGRLTVAQDCVSDQAWNAARQIPQLDGVVGSALGDRRYCVVDVAAEGTWSQAYHGPIRYASAELVRNLVGQLTRRMDDRSIVVLTPFRAQRVLIRQFLSNAGLKRVDVSTVHRAQGGERHTVIFDPVDGDSNFLRTEDARRLMNVAISRAQARLIILVSPGDRHNKLLDALTNIEAEVPVGAIPIAVFACLPDFPRCALGHIVQIGSRIVGEVTNVLDDGARFVVRDSRTGELRNIITAVIVQNSQGRHE